MAGNVIKRNQTLGRTYRKSLQGCMIQLLAALCRILSFIRALRFPNNFIAILLSEAWNKDISISRSVTAHLLRAPSTSVSSLRPLAVILSSRWGDDMWRRAPMTVGTGPLTEVVTDSPQRSPPLLGAMASSSVCRRTFFCVVGYCGTGSDVIVDVIASIAVKRVAASERFMTCQNTHAGL